MTAPVWLSSSFCAAGDCVEIALSDHPDLAHIRRRHGDFALWTHVVPRTELAALVAGAKAGDFDELLEECTP